MADAKALFVAEFGHYFEQATPDYPVGVCTRCLTLRTRDEVDGEERCPAELARVGFSAVADAAVHDWRGFTDRASLEEFIKDNSDKFFAVARQAADMVTVPAADDGAGG